MAYDVVAGRDDATVFRGPSDEVRTCFAAASSTPSMNSSCLRRWKKGQPPRQIGNFFKPAKSATFASISIPVA
jgi:hypothetical protein